MLFDSFRLCAFLFLLVIDETNEFLERLGVRSAAKSRPNFVIFERRASKNYLGVALGSDARAKLP